MPTIKCAIVIDPSLPPGVIANTAAVLALSVGRRFPQLVGADLRDSRGDVHHGITTIALPILGGSGERLRELRATLTTPAGELGEFSEITVIDLIGATRTTRSYADYAQALRATPAAELDYLGLALCGPAHLVRRVTGSLALLR